MINISRLAAGLSSGSDRLRYGAPRSWRDRRPVTVWNTTRACNLRCLHCYASAESAPAPDELSTDEARRMIDDLAAFGIPVLLLSGGEALLRSDLDDLAAYAVARGVRVALSTNGTLITPERARRLADAGVTYAGISLDGIGAENDRFRGLAGAFTLAMDGIRACREAGVRTGVRVTLHRGNVHAIGAMFDLCEREGVDRLCFYHLVYTGRAQNLLEAALSPAETRQAVDEIIDRTVEAVARGVPIEVLTVDNHCDGPYLYLRLRRKGDPRAEEVLELLRRTGGNSSGVGIACIDWNGDVHPDQFWRHVSLGNVRERPFSEIWMDTSHPLMAKLKEKRRFVRGRCATCRFLDCCGGNFRVRAEAVRGDLWAPDPACYLTDEEIGIV